MHQTKRKQLNLKANVVANVLLWGKHVGAVLWNYENDYATFEFEASFLSSGVDVAPLTMPIENASRGEIFQFAYLPKETFQGLLGLLSDALPDRFGNQLIDLWRASQGRDKASMSPVERLCYLGSRGMGALDFELTERNEKELSNGLEINALVELSKKALTIKESLDSHFSIRGGGWP